MLYLAAWLSGCLLGATLALGTAAVVAGSPGLAVAAIVVAGANLVLVFWLEREPSYGDVIRARSLPDDPR